MIQRYFVSIWKVKGWFCEVRWSIQRAKTWSSPRLLIFRFFVLHPHSTPPDLEGWADRVKEEPLVSLRRCPDVALFVPCSWYDWSSSSILEMWWLVRKWEGWSGQVRRRWEGGGERGRGASERVEGRWEGGSGSQWESAPVSSSRACPHHQSILTLGRRLKKLVFAVLAKTSLVAWVPGHDILWGCPLPTRCATRQP